MSGRAFPVVDAHVHAFPDWTVGMAWQAYIGVHEPKRSGACSELFRIMDDGGIDRAVLLLYPRSSEQYEQLVREAGPEPDEEEIRQLVVSEIHILNLWGCEMAESYPRLIPFVGVNPRFQTAAEYLVALDELVGLGARGVKLIPPSMRMYADDRRLLPLYQRCQELKLLILSQSGSGGGPPPKPGADHYGRPRYWERVLATFPELTVILAHLGLGYEDDLVELARRYPNVYADTSLRLSGLGKPGRWTAEQLVDLVRRIGADRVLLGSNYPFTDPAVYAQVLEQLPLSAEEREAIAGGNFARLMAARG